MELSIDQNDETTTAIFEMMITHDFIPRLVSLFHEIQEFNSSTLHNLKNFMAYEDGRYGELIRLADENLHKVIRNTTKKPNPFELMNLFWKLTEDNI